ncbi:hypothetical protein V7O66_05130 [Methanolobus sp. ZRKC3]|uniref:hypothetical protein n=1 Tax=Methanolobus sp. ZRKC3 TaxID=3125786 RepID=UPI003245BFAC
MHTVYIKSPAHNMLIDIDNLERMSYSGHQIYAHNLHNEQYPIYEGQAINGDKALAEIAALIHSAKRHSENNSQAVIIDFSNDLYNPLISLPMTRDIRHYKSA